MALIESVFRRDAYDRTMSFQTIAEETRLPLDEVEHLIMKALRCVFHFSFCSLSFCVFFACILGPLARLVGIILWLVSWLVGQAASRVANDASQ